MTLLPLALALVTAAVLVLVIGPLLKDTRAAPSRAGFDRAVYRDQLAELERDRARGLIGDAEAAAARLEIERRLLAADRGEPALPQQAAKMPRLAVALALGLACGAGALYLTLGAPGVPDLPFAARGGAKNEMQATAELEKTAAELRKQVAAKPNDDEGWASLGRTEADLGHWDDAVEAYRHAVELAPGRTDLAAAYGETQVLRADGVVTPAAQDVFRKILARDPKNGFARYYLALADAQAGNTDAAIAAWQKLAAEAPEGAPIRDELKRRIAAAATAAGKTPPPLAAPAAAPPAAAGAPGPDAAQMAAAANMPPEQRAAMIRGMVERLAQRLEQQPDDLQGWLRLGRAYGVMGERDKAADAYEHAAKLDPKNAEIPLQEVDALLAGQAMEAPLSDRVVALLHKVEVLSPGEPEALWYLGLAAAQAKQPDEAARYWQRLLAKLPADAPERKTVTAALDALKR
ncbi:MAG TPA: c-type cytochrome biogenesis protein CcmI [Stellaceae bacterium]|nr:c-type cytochrome biogenesis protein CcmI [Stellaceae bacterium]